MVENQIMDRSFLVKRRAVLSQHQSMIGIDFAKLLVLPTLHLEIHFIPKAHSSTASVLPLITPNDIAILNKNNSNDVPFSIQSVHWATDDNSSSSSSNIENKLIINLIDKNPNPATDNNIYIVNLEKLPNIDPFFSSTIFFRRGNIEADTDCLQPLLNLSFTEAALSVNNATNYLAKDFTSFRQLMWSNLSMRFPDWAEDNPADFANVIVETLAYAADQISYYQDAVATEAYLSTARKRVSVRRHARLLNYHVHEGCNARVWVQIQVNQHFNLAQNTVILSKIANSPTCIKQSTVESIDQFASANLSMVFATLHDIDLYPEHNEITFYSWGNTQFTIPAGAITAVLQGNFPNLKPGAVLIFEMLAGSNEVQGTNFIHRHAVRIVNVISKTDALSATPTDITEITWHADDALPFNFPINQNGLTTVGRGNIVLCDNGLPIIDEALSPPIVPWQGVYQPAFKHTDLTFSVAFNSETAQKQSATYALQQDPHAAVPVVSLTTKSEATSTNSDNQAQIWNAKQDLLDSNYLSQDFVVEMENDRKAYIRFGDGIFGKHPFPGTQFIANYRSGNGSSGNIGAEVLAHIIIPDDLAINILQVRNPFPAQGGTDPEPLDQVKLLAPNSIINSQRCVIPNDYVQLLKQYPGVKRVAAELAWTGSWNTLFVTIEQQNMQPLDDVFKQAILDYLKQYQMIGQNIVITSPKYVPLDIALVVKIKPGYAINTIKHDLTDRFSTNQTQNNQRGFFHPENFGFGDSVYLSQIIAEAMAVPGVDYIDLQSTLSRFGRWCGTNNNCLEQPERNQSLISEKISIGHLEIAQVINNPTAPEQGQITFYMENSA